MNPELENSTSQYRLLFDNMMSGFILFDVVFDENNLPVDFKFIEANSAFEKITGLSATEQINKKSSELEWIWPKNYNNTFFDIATSGSGVFDYEHFNSNLNKYLEIRVFSPQKNKLAVIFNDITLRKQSDEKIIRDQEQIEKKKVEHALLESEERYKRLLSSVTGYVYTSYIENGVFGRTSHGLGCENITGYTPDDYNRDPYLWFKMIHFEDRTLVNDKISLIRNITESLSFEHRITHKNGNIRWISNTLVPHRNINNEIICYDGIVTDITERKQAEIALKESEARLRTVVRNIPIVLFAIDSKGIFTLSEGKGLENLGFKPGQVVGLSSYEVYKDYPVIKEAIIGSLNGEITHYEALLGNSWFEAWHNPVQNIFGKVTGLIGVAIDTTERKKYETELKELNITKDKFFSIIAHDLKGPFSGVLGLSEVLYEKSQINDYNNVVTYSRTIFESLKNTYDLLINLLEWARIQTRNIKFNPENISLNIIVNEVVNNLCHNANQKNIEIIKFIEPNIEVFADKNMIATVLRNFLSNAIKFSRKGDQIKISVYKSGDYIHISVEDNGIGIKEADLKKLFRIDTHFSTRGTSDERGTGLGLILCKEFIEKHNSEIKVESQEGKGSKFWFYLKA